MNLITDYVTREDIDVFNKIINLEDGEQISSSISRKAQKKEKEIESVIWELMNKDERFMYLDDYDGLAPGWNEEDGYSLESAELYNNDWLYMMAIAKVLGLKEPEDCFDNL